MPVHNFHVGDRVLCVANAPDGNTSVYDLTGTVVDVDGLDIGVCWDGPVGGHDCGGRCKEGYGWYVRGADIEKLTDAVFDICPEENLTSLLGAQARN